MKDNDIFTLGVRLNIVLVSIAILVLSTSFAIVTSEQKEKINTLENQVIELQEENQFLKEHYEEEIIMLDSQLLTLEAEFIEMKNGVEVIKK